MQEVEFNGIYDSILKKLRELPLDRREKLCVRSMPFGDIMEADTGVIHVAAAAFVCSNEWTSLWRNWSYQLCREAKDGKPPTVKRNSKAFRFSPEICEKWRLLQSTLKEAAVPFTGGKELPVSIFLLEYIPGVQEAHELALRSVRAKVKNADLSSVVLTGRNGEPFIEVSWKAG